MLTLMALATYRSMSQYFMSTVDEDLHYKCLEKKPTMSMHNKL